MRVHCFVYCLERSLQVICSHAVHQGKHDTYSEPLHVRLCTVFIKLVHAVNFTVLLMWESSNHSLNLLKRVKYEADGLPDDLYLHEINICKMTRA